jgi:hypothetical protein
LGAVVAPPDAAAATAVLKEVRLPHRLLVILEGESLLNDASALLIYRLAVGATVVHAGATLGVASTLSLVLVGSVAMGVLFAFGFNEIVQRFSDVPSSIIMQFIGTFGVWILADRLHLSGVLVIVTFAVILARRAPIRTPAAVRVPSYAVWETVVFLLNALAFVLVGLQIGPILSRIGPAERVQTFTRGDDTSRHDDGAGRLGNDLQPDTVADKPRPWTTHPAVDGRPAAQAERSRCMVRHARHRDSRRRTRLARWLGRKSCFPLSRPGRADSFRHRFGHTRYSGSDTPSAGPGVGTGR